ncbi:MAG: fatty acid desaturase [Thainema sp.]
MQTKKLSNLPSQHTIRTTWIGALFAGILISLWIGSLIQLLTTSLNTEPIWLIIGAVLGRTFLHTGLFVIAHDAIHCNLLPQSKLMNRWIGQIALWLYAFLSYSDCHKNHWQHHNQTATPNDPDFQGSDSHPFCWYLNFMRAYFPIRQIIGFIASGSLFFVVLSSLFQITWINILLFWLLPLILSSIQLFFFGTYLPHKAPNQHGSAPNSEIYIHSVSYSPLWSFLACYHFGYHWEHHTYPDVPWYRLPAVHRQSHSPQHLGHLRL